MSDDSVNDEAANELRIEAVIEALTPHMDWRCPDCAGTGLRLVSNLDCNFCDATGIRKGSFSDKAREVALEVLAIADEGVEAKP